ncbi:MAG TPA: L-aspartate oxidase [Longimicrobiales bacterium]|nr:L-aspartate oxidase [Longimicrobiales bacterium]
MTRVETDVLVIGSGIAGLSFALNAAARASVALITKKERVASSTNYAQGGIAAVMSPDDSVDLHVRDTLTAGAGLCHRPAVEGLAADGPARVRELIEWGVHFTSNGDSLSLGREGGHSRRRIVHAQDLTGREIEQALLAALSRHANVTLYEDHHAIDLAVGWDAESGERRCAGAYVLNHRTRELLAFQAGFTLLATGGLGQAYRYTTNPEIATGDGIAMAFRAGTEIRNLEFVQFHPTALYPAEGRAFLISEAVRGEGAVLRRIDGSPLMSGLHRLGSLAPRDVVARAIDAHLKESGDSYVLLDLSPIDPAAVRQRFPNIVAECASRGIDATREPLPVVPAAHYSCGGVWTDRWGRTSLAGLFAAGEVACTGVHGANRLASNSLLEAVVYSHRAAELVPTELARPRARPRAEAALGKAAARENDQLGWASAREQLRALMWQNAGIVRSDARLARADHVLTEQRAQVDRAFLEFAPAPELIELRNLLDVAALVVQCARSRKESRGLHYNVDYPYRDNERCLGDTVLNRAG